MADDDLERLRARAEAFDGDGESDSDDMYEDAPEQYSKQNAVNDSEEESQEESDLDSSSEEDSEDENAAAASSRSAPDRAMRALLSLATAEGDDARQDEGEDDSAEVSLAAVPFGERERMRKCGFDDRETIVRRAQQLAEQRRRALRAGSGTARRKNAPREMSSKVPVGRLREVVLPEEMRQRVHRKPSRDPRFSDLSGRLNKDLFDKSYAFLEDHRKDDIAQLRQLLRDSKDERKRRIAQQQLNRLQQQQQQHVRDSARKELKRKRRAQEGEAVTQGKQPFFLKENERRKLEVQERYESLKEQGKLQKYMTKKRKRNAAKERKRMPEMGRRDQS